MLLFYQVAGQDVDLEELLETLSSGEAPEEKRRELIETKSFLKRAVRYVLHNVHIKNSYITNIQLRS